MENKATYGLIGQPLAHSLSPIIHNTAFAELHLDAVYKLFPLKADELDIFFADLKRASSPIFGLNVTVPYKESVLKYLDSLSPFARKVGAVNTIVILKERYLVGYNTDGPGFLAHLAELGVATSKKRVVMLGAGGAARAIISVLCLLPERPQAISIYDVDKAKANALIVDLGRQFDVSIAKVVNSIDDLRIEQADLLINATPVGMKKGDPQLVDKKFFRPGLFVYDLVYNPRETQLLKTAREQGSKVANGLGMLFYQGILAFQHWADVQLSPEVKEKIRGRLEEAI